MTRAQTARAIHHSRCGAPLSADQIATLATIGSLGADRILTAQGMGAAPLWAVPIGRGARLRALHDALERLSPAMRATRSRSSGEVSSRVLGPIMGHQFGKAVWDRAWSALTHDSAWSKVSPQLLALMPRALVWLEPARERDDPRGARGYHALCAALERIGWAASQSQAQLDRGELPRAPDGGDLVVWSRMVWDQAQGRCPSPLYRRASHDGVVPPSGCDVAAWWADRIASAGQRQEVG